MDMPQSLDPDSLMHRLDALLGSVARACAGDFTGKPEIPDDGDPLAGFVTGLRFLLDDLEQAHIERRREQERFREIDALKTRFINMAAHDLGTPLTPILMQLRLLSSKRSGPLNERQARSLEILLRNVQRVAKLVQDLLDVAKLEQGALRLKLAPVDLVSILREAGDTYHGLGAERGVEIAVEAPDQLVIQADELRLHQVLTNLMDNALRYTPSGGRITLRLLRHGRHVRVEVQDTGSGLLAEQMARLFKPFSQVDAAAHQGSGLGLFICKGIVERHGGKIWCDSAGRGQGTTMAFQLPLDSPVGAAAARPPSH
jgi:signal transduction histidine kinase